jgi:DNA-binding Lrp family transcriptional regulator|tara:strand:+ start:1657 stop:1905 length:249 start_codon:yes stop_codon:yes gene_type:complete
MISYVLITCQPGTEPDVISEIKSIPEVVEVNGIMGKYDIFVKIHSDTPDELDLAVSKLRKIKIMDSHTLPVIFGQGGSIDEK